MLGASASELGLVAMILGMVVLALVVPRVGERVGALFEGEGDRSRGDPPGK